MMRRHDWPDTYWDPIVGCTQVSEGCRNCRAHGIFPDGFSTPVIRESHLLDPYEYGPDCRQVGTAMSSDLFHEGLDASTTTMILKVMLDLPQHTFWVLTKRPERLAQFQYLGPIQNLTLGVSCEDAATLAARLPLLLDSPLPGRRVLAAKPLLGRLDLTWFLDAYSGAHDLDMVSLGIERDPRTGEPTYRSDDANIRRLMAECQALNIPTRLC